MAYTNAQRDALIDKLLAEVADLKAQQEPNDLAERVTSIEDATVPAVDTVQDDVTKLASAAKGRQEAMRSELSKPQRVLRPSVARVRRPDGRIVQRIVKPR